MAVNHVNGGMYMITYTDQTGNTSTTIGITGNTYDPNTIWKMAKGLIGCVKEIWFAPQDVVKVVSIESHGEVHMVEDPDA